MTASASARAGKTPRPFCSANPEIAAKIEAAVRQNAGLIADQILAGEGEAEEDDAAES